MSPQDRSAGRPDRRAPRSAAMRAAVAASSRTARCGRGAATPAGRPIAEPDRERGGQRLTPKSPRRPEPAIADGVTGKELDRSVWTQLRTLSKENAEGVAQHLVMVGPAARHRPRGRPGARRDRGAPGRPGSRGSGGARAGRLPAGRLGQGARRVPDRAPALRLVTPAAAHGRRRAGAGPAGPGPRAGLHARGADAGPRREGRAGHRRLRDPAGPGPARRRGRRPPAARARPAPPQGLERPAVLRLRRGPPGPRRPRRSAGVVRLRGRRGRVARDGRGRAGRRARRRRAAGPPRR